jgi:predicted RNA-binding Zn ribbon-like protein
MQFNAYTAAGAHIAAWLVSNPSADAAAVAATLASHDVHQPVTPTGAELRGLRAWTARLRTVFDAGSEPERADLTDALLVDADCRPRLVRHGPGRPYHLHYAPVATGLVARVRALTAAGLAHVIDEGEGARLRSCQRAGCGVAFLDTSRNGGRRFCSLRCANRVNVARHRARLARAG